MIWLPISVSLFAISIVILLFWLIKRRKEGTKRMKEIASFIREGAKAFLKREIKTMLPFIIMLTLILSYILRWEIGLGFLVGSFSSIIAAYIGMISATYANVRTANDARKSASSALKTSLRGGAITGLSIVGISLLGLTLLFLLFNRNPSLLVGFGFGASLAALFAQLGGGIYTKAADVGADLVGKVEKKIPEDDPRNPAVIADLVGDNVGDCAGRGADLFESFSDEIIGVMILGLAFITLYGTKAIIFPLLMESIGIIATLVGVTFIREWKNPFFGVNILLVVSGITCLIGFYILSVFYMESITLFYCSTLGLIASVVVAFLIQYYTGLNQKPVYEIAKSAKSGAAINLMTGFSYGLESVVSPILVISAVILLAYLIGGIYGVAAATLGILSTTGIIMSSDAFGPIADNADGIIEMSKVKAKGTETLDAIGNMTKAITKGYAMSCAVLAAVVLLFAYLFQAEISFIDISKPLVLIGLFIGATIPFLFSGLTIRSVGKTAYKVVEEVRRQFREIKGLLMGKAKPQYDRCVDIVTKNALKEMLLPTLIAIISPILIGFLLGVESLGAYLASSTISSASLALLMYNAGGALDNAKKFIEKGNFGGKGTDTHAASIIGDTFGDPLKDTAGPSLHILIKLQTILALTLLPLFLKYVLLV